MLDASDVLRVLDQLDQAGLVVWLDGGWGVDALLGRHSRPHHDLDLVIARDACPRAQAVLAGTGFRHDPAAVPGLPSRVVLVDPEGRQVDLHPVIFDTAATAGRTSATTPGAATRRKASPPPARSETAGSAASPPSSRSATTSATRSAPPTATT